MKTSEIMKEYSDFKGAKSGFLTERGKLVYLYNNVCCEAVCRRIALKSDKDEIFARFARRLFAQRRGDKLAVYRGGRRILKLRELIILYEIPIEDGSLYGVFTYERDKRLMDSHFTDGRIAELIDSLILDENGECSKANGRFAELARAVQSGEVSALNKIYINGRKIKDEGML